MEPDQQVDEKEQEKLILFDFDENECDIVIMTKDKEVHLPSSFLHIASSDSKTLPFVNGKMVIDVMSDNLVHALSFYDPKNWKGCEEIESKQPTLSHVF